MLLEVFAAAAALSEVDMQLECLDDSGLLVVSMRQVSSIMQYGYLKTASDYPTEEPPPSLEIMPAALE